MQEKGFTVSLQNFGQEEIVTSLEQGYPVIVGVHTSDLSYWTRGVDHVIVVVGADDDSFYVNDPAFTEGQPWVSQHELALAQLAFDNLCAVLKRD